MSNPSLTDPLSLGSPVPRNAHCKGKVLILLALLIGFGFALLRIPRTDGGDEQKLFVRQPAITMPLSYSQYLRLAMPTWFSPTSLKPQFMQPMRAGQSVPLMSRAPVMAAAALFGIGDVVSHKSRGHGKVVAVDPVTVKYDDDPDPEPIKYEDDDGNPMPEKVLKERLTLVSHAESSEDAPNAE